MVKIKTSVVGKNLKITVSDKGVGIPESERLLLFKPFASSKVDGMGIGLFMAHEMTERHFRGTLDFAADDDETLFIITVPRARTRTPVRVTNLHK